MMMMMRIIIIIIIIIQALWLTRMAFVALSANVPMEISQTPCFGRSDCSGLCGCSSNQGTPGSVTLRWEATRWFNTDSMAGRQSFVMGRDGRLSVSGSAELGRGGGAGSISQVS